MDQGFRLETMRGQQTLHAAQKEEQNPCHRIGAPPKGGQRAWISGEIRKGPGAGAAPRGPGRVFEFRTPVQIPCTQRGPQALGFQAMKSQEPRMGRMNANAFGSRSRPSVSTSAPSAEAFRDGLSWLIRAPKGRFVATQREIRRASPQGHKGKQKIQADRAGMKRCFGLDSGRACARITLACVPHTPSRNHACRRHACPCGASPKHRCGVFTQKQDDLISLCSLCPMWPRVLVFL